MAFKIANNENHAIPHKLPEQLLAQITRYIDAHYVDTYDASLYCFSEDARIPDNPRREAMRAMRMHPSVSSSLPCTPLKSVSLEEMLRQEDAGFTETLLKLIDKTGNKDSEIYKKANISKQHFSKIRTNPDYRPTKSTAIALALALELDLEETKDLIGRAGYALTNSSKFDLIIRYFIEKKNYNIVEINMALYEFDQALLGG